LFEEVIKSQHRPNVRRKEEYQMDKKELAIKEYERLKSLFANADEAKVNLVDELLKKAAFLKIELDSLENGIRRNGVMQLSNKGNARITLSYKAYLQSISIYSNIIKTLNTILGGTEDDGDDSFDEFLKKVEER
jgi:hypothetical protein